MDCILKIIAGPETGQEFACPAGETYIGRSQRCLIRLAAPSISFEHVLITRLADDYFAENLSANGTLLNGQRLAAKTRLRPKDQLQIGECIARVERLPAATAAAGNRRWLLLGFVALLALALFIVVLDPFSSTSSTSTLHVYRIFQSWSQDQVTHAGMPREVPPLMAEAWRLQSAGDHDGAAKAWIKVDVTLDNWDRQQGRVDTLHSTQGLEQLQSGKKDSLPDEDMRIALKQWITQMERGP